MKVLLVNGSAHPNGCTAFALDIVAKTLQAEGIETETLVIGNSPVSDCVACGSCAKGTGKCAIDNDIVNTLLAKAEECDGFVFGSPVYYAHPSARLLAVMDRAFYAGGKAFKFKPVASVLSARRAGSVASMDVLNKHFSILSMPIVSSTYWNHVFGNKPEEAVQDEEGVMTMVNIGKNMAWLLKCIEAGKRNGIDKPENVKIKTNFIR